MNPMVLEWALMVVTGVHIPLAVSRTYDLKYNYLLKIGIVIFLLWKCVQVMVQGHVML